jgi:hypothetical protein
MTTATPLANDHLGQGRRHPHRWIRVSVAAIAVVAVVVVGLVAVEVTRSVLVIPKTDAGSSPAPTFPAPPAAHAATLSTVAQFPAKSFVENLAVRHDGSILVTEETKHQLWYLPAPIAGAQVQPLLLHTFGQRPMGIVEAEPNVFYVTMSNLGKLRSAYLYRVDLRNWHPGTVVPVNTVLHFPPQVFFLDGSTLIDPHTMLEADAIGGVIWRVDLSSDGTTATAREWLKDPSMTVERNNHIKGVPGVNGIRYDGRTRAISYTSTGQKLFMRERVDPPTLNPVGAPVLIA